MSDGYFGFLLTIKSWKLDAVQNIPDVHIQWRPNLLEVKPNNLKEFNSDDYCSLFKQLTFHIPQVQLFLLN